MLKTREGGWASWITELLGGKGIMIPRRREDEREEDDEWEWVMLVLNDCAERAVEMTKFDCLASITTYVKYFW